jgi:hypothetical protein
MMSEIILEERLKKLYKEKTQISDDSISLLAKLTVEETVRHLVELVTECTVKEIIKEEPIAQ